MQNVNKRCEYWKGKEKQTSYASNLEEIHYKSVPWTGKAFHITVMSHFTDTGDDVFFLP